MTWLRREEVLAYEARRKVYALVRDEPGLHLRELERRLAMPLSTLRHHLRYLLEHGLVETEDDRHLVRYFVKALHDEPDRQTMGALRQEALRRVLLYVLERGGRAEHGEMLADLGIPPSTLATYLAQLVRRNVLARRSLGRVSRYELTDADRLIRLLHTYRASLLDAWVDRLLDVIYQDEPDRS